MELPRSWEDDAKIMTGSYKIIAGIHVEITWGEFP